MGSEMCIRDSYTVPESTFGIGPAMKPADVGAQPILNGQNVSQSGEYVT